MKLESFASTSLDSDKVLEDITKNLSMAPDLILIYMTVGMPMDKILKGISQKYPKTKIAGSTSCRGVMTNTGFHSLENQGIAGMAFYSNSSDYGVGFSAVEKNGMVNVAKACDESLISAKNSAILPSLIWMISSAGIEELCIEEMKNYFGTFVPVFGGTAADNDISGNWRLFSGGGIHNSGLIIISFFDIPLPHFSFHCGYQQTNFKGLVTKAEGRKLIEIDNKPAAEIYNEWTDGAISQFLDKEKLEPSQNILSVSSLLPLARQKGQVGSFPYFLLSHPETLTNKREMTLFTNIKSGEEVVLMEGSVEALQTRASEVVSSILERERIKEADIAGALIVFCAGCMLTVTSISSMQPVVEGIKTSLGEKVPFLGIFSYGEVGCFFEENNFHGNLMISVTVFLKEHDS
jgi:hypothetical protein